VSLSIHAGTCLSNIRYYPQWQTTYFETATVVLLAHHIHSFEI